MRKNILMISALLMLLACGGKKTQTESADVSDSKDEEAKEEIVGLINDLYAAEARNEGDIDRRFACSAWRKMVAAVNEKDSQLEEIGFFNDEYWTMMQDTNPDDLEARDIKIEELDAKEGRAEVSFTLCSSVQTVRQKFALCCEDGEWRVHDIIRFYDESDGEESSFSFREAMQDYLNEPME